MDEMLKDVSAPFGMNWTAVFIFFVVATLGAAAGRWIVSKVQ